jgi:hypothetical protein
MDVEWTGLNREDVNKTRSRADEKWEVEVG